MKNNINLLMLFVLAFSWIGTGLSAAEGLEIFVYIFGTSGFIALITIFLNTCVFKNKL